MDTIGPHIKVYRLCTDDNMQLGIYHSHLSVDRHIDQLPFMWFHSYHNIYYSSVFIPVSLSRHDICLVV